MSAVPVAAKDTRREQLREFAAALKVGLDPSGDLRVTYADPEEAINGKFGYWTKPLNGAAIDGRINFSRNLYFCVGASRSSISEKGEKVWRRRKGDIAAGLMVGFDDIGTKCRVPLSWFVEQLPPTVVTETSPGNYQVLYFFDAPLFDTHYFSDVLDSIITPLSERYGIDHLADTTRVLRLPFGVNNKRDEETGFLKYPKAWRVRLVSADYSRRYSPQEIASAYGLEIVRSAEPQPRVVVEQQQDYWDREKAFREFVNATRAAKGTLKPVLTAHGEKYRIECPFGGEHASGGRGDSAFIADPAASENNAYTFYCMHASCVDAHSRKLRTFDAAMRAAGIDIDAIRRARDEEMDRANDQNADDLWTL